MRTTVPVADVTTSLRVSVRSVGVPTTRIFAPVDPDRPMAVGLLTADLRVRAVMTIAPLAPAAMMTVAVAPLIVLADAPRMARTAAATTLEDRDAKVMADQVIANALAVGPPTAMDVVVRPPVVPDVMAAPKVAVSTVVTNVRRVTVDRAPRQVVPVSDGPQLA